MRSATATRGGTGGPARAVRAGPVPQMCILLFFVGAHAAGHLCAHCGGEAPMPRRLRPGDNDVRAVFDRRGA